MTARTITSWRRSTAAHMTAVALGVVLCAGCAASDGDEPAPSASSSETSSAAAPDATPTEVPPYDGTAAPQMPADMASDSHLGARAAATYLFEARNWAIISGDPSALEAVCDPASVFCSKSLALVLEEAAEGVTSSGGFVDFTITEVLPPDSERDFYEVRGSVDQEPITRRSAAGEVIEVTQGADDLPYVVFVESVENRGWIVRGADISS